MFFKNRKIISVILFSFSLSLLFASPSKGQKVIDLTKLNQIMLYTQVYNMVWTPEEFRGTYVKIKGKFYSSVNPEDNKTYYAVVVSDMAGCCMAGLDFVLGPSLEGQTLPSGECNIEVHGTYVISMMNGFEYPHIEADFVSY